jgi:hypothetical protein
VVDAVPGGDHVLNRGGRVGWGGGNPSGENSRPGARDERRAEAAAGGTDGDRPGPLVGVRV